VEKRSQEKVLNPTVVRLGLVSLFADISSEMLYPITPIFLATVLGASMTSIGFIEGVAEAVASLLKTFAGSWSDRIQRRKPFVVAGYFLSAMAKPLTGVATAWVHVLCARGLDRTGKGLRSAPRDALLAEAVSPKSRGAAFGWHRAMDTIGATIGPLLAITYLAFYNNDLRSIYYFAVIPGVISVFFVLSIKEKKVLQANAKQNESTVFLPRAKWRDLPKDFKAYLFSWGVFSVANSSDVFLLMRAKEQGMSLNLVIFMYCFYNLTFSLMSPYFGKLSDRVPRKNILILGLFIFSLVYLGFSMATSHWHFWLLFGIYGLYMAATDGVGKALAVDLVDSRMKATGLGILGTVTGISTVFASTISGGIWDQFGPSWTFIFGMAGALTAMVLLTRVQVWKKN